MLTICWSLKYAVDWIIEILNAFSHPSNNTSTPFNLPPPTLPPSNHPKNMSSSFSKSPATLHPSLRSLFIFVCNALITAEETLFMSAQRVPFFFQQLRREAVAAGGCGGGGGGGGRGGGSSKDSSMIDSSAGVKRKKKKSSTDEGNEVNAQEDQITLNQVQDMLEPLMRRLRPSVAIALGFGIRPIPLVIGMHHLHTYIYIYIEYTLYTLYTSLYISIL